MKSSSVQYMADTLPVEQKLYRLWTVCSISIRKKGWAIMQFYHFSNVLTLTAPMKSLSAMAISIPKKSFSSILDDRQIIFLLAPSGNIFENKGNRCSDSYVSTLFGRVTDIGGMLVARYSG